MLNKNKVTYNNYIYLNVIAVRVFKLLDIFCYPEPIDGVVVSHPVGFKSSCELLSSQSLILKAPLLCSSQIWSLHLQYVLSVNINKDAFDDKLSSQTSEWNITCWLLTMWLYVCLCVCVCAHACVCCRNAASAVLCKGSFGGSTTLGQGWNWNLLFQVWINTNDLLLHQCVSHWSRLTIYFLLQKPLLPSSRQTEGNFLHADVYSQLQTQWGCLLPGLPLPLHIFCSKGTC